MKTFLAQNQFNSAPVATPAADTAAASSDLQPRAAAGPIFNSGRVEGACSGIKRGVNPTQGGESSTRDRTSGLPDATSRERPAPNSSPENRYPLSDGEMPSIETSGTEAAVRRAAASDWEGPFWLVLTEVLEFEPIDLDEAPLFLRSSLA